MTVDLTLKSWGMKVLTLCKEYQQIVLNMKCERVLVHFLEWSQLQQTIHPCAKSVFIHRQIDRLVVMTEVIVLTMIIVCGFSGF